ncbi:low molecular weight protein-tyrosine-phosphatase [Nannocystaceae bacterium ST9]
MAERRIAVCFVCLGNICRSPTAEGVFQHLVERAGLADRFVIDSAGTGAWHAGERADPRARAEAKRRGVELASIARQVVAGDFARFDWLIAMDRRNRADLLGLARGEPARQKVRLFREFDPSAPREAEVPDPYYGGEQGFAEVFDICWRAGEGLLEQLRGQLGP